ncbi:thiolase family protein [Paraburkholderia sp. A1RI-2L]|uniref:thiolase family protein n=1 Tax=Paraburkholderia sp. A1RI-2L TaxID=3028367 RepID=UPI003B79CC71
MKSSVAVVGVGTTGFGRLPDRTSFDLGVEALQAALDDAGLEAADIDGLVVARIPDNQRFAELAGLAPKVSSTWPAAGRVCGIAIAYAAMLIESGQARRVALVYGNDGRSAGATYGGAGDAYGGGMSFWAPYGMTSPGAFHALMYARYAHEHRSDPAALAEISLTFRRHAALNPLAVMKKPLTRDDYFASRYIAEPLRLLDYCLINDGGVAMIMSAAQEARGLAKPPVYLAGHGQCADFAGASFPPADHWRGALASAHESARAMAGRGAAEADALMLYDNFTPAVLFELEGLGLAEAGRADRLVLDGALGLQGAHPANPSGGHLSESYMQGWALNVEAVRQIRGEALARQIPGAETIVYACTAPQSSVLIYGGEA